MYFNVRVTCWVLIYSIALLCFMIGFCTEINCKVARFCCQRFVDPCKNCTKEELAETTALIETQSERLATTTRYKSNFAATGTVAYKAKGCGPPTYY